MNNHALGGDGGGAGAGGVHCKINLIMFNRKIFCRGIEVHVAWGLILNYMLIYDTTKLYRIEHLNFVKKCMYQEETYSFLHGQKPFILRNCQIINSFLASESGHGLVSKKSIRKLKDLIDISKICAEAYRKLSRPNILGCYVDFCQT